LFVAAYVLLKDLPTAAASDADYIAFYANASRWRILIGAFYLVPFAGIAFIWFLAVLRQRSVRLEGTEDALLATVQLVSGVLFVALVFAATAAGAATSAAIELSGASLESAASTRQLMALSQTLLMVFAVRCAGVFVLSGTARARRTALFPRWFIGPSIVVALVLLLATTFYRPVVLLFPVWVATASILVLRLEPTSSDQSNE
jgi:hypothetical protein